MLNSLPQLVPSITTTSNNPSNGGQANVDLRGLGTTRTLVLMDGTRLAASNVNGVIDLNTIPSALIDSVEILTGGASADVRLGRHRRRRQRAHEAQLLGRAAQRCRTTSRVKATARHCWPRP